MYAVIKTGGKQYRAAVGETVRVEKIEADTGSELEMDEVLLVSDGKTLKVGTPVVDGAKVLAEVMMHGRDKKINIIKFKRRKHHMKRMGHRQWFTDIRIKAINC